jgi:uncharacterized protein (TIGR02001 family)
MRGPAPYLCCIAVVLAIAPGPAAGGERWRSSVALTTDYVLRGVSQTDSGPAFQAGLTYDSPRGWYAGVWGSNVETGRDFYPDEGAHTELDLFAGYSWPVGRRWSADVRLLRYEYPDNGSFLDYDYSEVVLGLAYRDWLDFSVAVSNDTTLITYRGVAKDRTAIAWDLGIERPLGSRLWLFAGLGYYDLQDLYGTGYTYGNLGLYTDIGPVRLDLSHYRTDASGTDLFGSELAGARTVLSVITSFR